MAVAEHRLGIVPTPAELLADPERALDLPFPEAATMLARVGALDALLRVRLAASQAPESDREQPAGEDGLLSAADAARRTGMSKRWLYVHADTLPFARRIGRAVRFSPAGIERWLSTRKTLKRAQEI